MVEIVEGENWVIDPVSVVINLIIIFLLLLGTITFFQGWNTLALNITKFCIGGAC